MPGVFKFGDVSLGTADDFAIVRDLLSGAGFNEAAIARRLGVALLTQVTIDHAAEAPEAIDDALDLLIRLFVRGVFVEERAIEQHLSSAEAAALARLGLIAGELQKYSPVCLCPVGGVYTVSDRWKTPEGAAVEAVADIVYPSVVPNTRVFLDLLPESPCEALLDLCSGTGVAALIGASKFAKQAYAYDIAQRSTLFAEFAARLNGLTNISAATGDLYEPAGDSTFDRIVAHPPYVPVLETKWIFYGGGDDGEHVTRRIVEGLPRYLRPGGRLYCLAMASDRAGHPLENRMREWLGPDHGQFDIAVVVRHTMQPAEFAFQSLSREAGSGGNAKRWKELFESRGVTALPYAMIMVQRNAAARAPFTVRRQAGAHTSSADYEWLLRWETAAADRPACVLDIPLTASPECELMALNRLAAAEWEAVEYSLLSSRRFRMEMKVEAWIGYLLTRCDGAKNGRQVFEELKADGVLNADAGEEEFAGVLRVLVSGGFVIAR